MDMVDAFGLLWKAIVLDILLVAIPGFLLGYYDKPVEKGARVVALLLIPPPAALVAASLLAPSSPEIVNMVVTFGGLWFISQFFILVFVALGVDVSRSIYEKPAYKSFEL